MVKGTQKDNEYVLRFWRRTFLFFSFFALCDDHDCKCKCSDELCTSVFSSVCVFFVLLSSVCYAFSLSVRSHFYFSISMLFAPITILDIVVVTFFFFDPFSWGFSSLVAAQFFPIRSYTHKNFFRK